MDPYLTLALPLGLVALRRDGSVAARVVGVLGLAAMGYLPRRLDLLPMPAASVLALVALCALCLLAAWDELGRSRPRTARPRVRPSSYDFDGGGLTAS